MGEMTSKERMKGLILREKIDRVPITLSITYYAGKVAGLSPKQYYLNPKSAFEAQCWAIKLHKNDGGVSYGAPEWEGLDFGGELEFSNDSLEFIPRVLKRGAINENQIEDLKVPDITKAPRSSRILEFSKLSFEKFGSAGISAGSPMCVAQTIAGLDNIIRWFIKKPELVHKLLRISTDYLIANAEKHVELFGAENISAGGNYPIESNQIMSPKMFEKFSLPYIIEIQKRYTELGIKKWKVHLCGDHYRNLSYWKDDIKMPSRTIFTSGFEMDLKEVSKYFNSEYIVGGNIRNAIIQSSTPNEVYEESRKIIERLKGLEGGFIFSPDCALTPLAPPSNIQAMIEAVNIFGKY